MSITGTRRAEISAIVTDIRGQSKNLARKDIDATDPDELNEAREILRRIEERVLANMPDVKAMNREAAE